jgi:3-oxoacyl-[acyl-carrier protein] reductase
MKVEGKAAVITGGGTGVGRATGLALGKLGCAVLVNYSRSNKEAEETAKDIEALGVKAIPFKADVADDAKCRAMIDKAVKEFGRLDILVNNAGTTSFIPHPDLDAVKDEDWDRIMAVNVKGTFQCTRAARGPLEEAGEGEIINITSVAGLAGTGSSIPYCASKAAIINMTVTLARALAPKIRVNAVAPGFINGRWLRAGIGDAYEGVKAATAERLPLGRVCEPEDIAEAILSLITGSDLVTGHVLPCEGGMLIA